MTIKKQETVGDQLAKPISEIIKESNLNAEEVLAFDTMLDMPIEIVGAEVREGDYGEYVVILHKTEDGSILGLSCGGKVVVRKIKQLIEGDSFPVSATPIKVNRYYDLK